MKGKNIEDYDFITLVYSRAIPPPDGKGGKLQIALPPLNFNPRYNIDFKKFSEYAYVVEKSEQIFQVLVFLNEEDLKIKEKERKNHNWFEPSLYVLEEEFEIDVWEMESKIDYDNKTAHINSAKLKIISYTKRVKRQTFQNEEYLYIQVIMKKSKELDNYTFTSNTFNFCTKEDALFIYNNIEYVNAFTEPNVTDKDSYHLKDNRDRKIMSKEELKKIILDDFVEGQNFFSFEEIWNLSEFKSSDWVHNFLNS